MTGNTTAKEIRMANRPPRSPGRYAWYRHTPCPQCAVPEGRVCKTPRGHKLQESHVARRRASGPYSGTPKP